MSKLSIWGSREKSTREQHTKGDASARGGEIRASLSRFRRSFARCLAARLDIINGELASRLSGTRTNHPCRHIEQGKLL